MPPPRPPRDLFIFLRKNKLFAILAYLRSSLNPQKTLFFLRKTKLFAILALSKILSNFSENLIFPRKTKLFAILALSKVLSKSLENLIFPQENQAFSYLGPARAAQLVPLGPAPLSQGHAGIIFVPFMRKFRFALKRKAKKSLVCVFQ